MCKEKVKVQVVVKTQKNGGEEGFGQSSRKLAKRKRKGKRERHMLSSLYIVPVS